MGYAGYAPGHKTDMRTPLQEYLKMVKVDKSLETIEKLTRNSAQSPGEDKFRKVRPRRAAFLPCCDLRYMSASTPILAALRPAAIMPTEREEVTW